MEWSLSRKPQTAQQVSAVARDGLARQRVQAEVPSLNGDLVAPMVHNIPYSSIEPSRPVDDLGMPNRVKRLPQRRKLSILLCCSTLRVRNASRARKVRNEWEFKITPEQSRCKKRSRKKPAGRAIPRLEEAGDRHRRFLLQIDVAERLHRTREKCIEVPRATARWIRQHFSICMSVYFTIPINSSECTVFGEPEN